MSNPFVICFAGVSGCGKSSIAHELSIELAIPRFELDKIRQEVKDDFWAKDFQRSDVLDAFNERAKERYLRLLERRQSHVLDSSVDRVWGELKHLYEKNGFRWFLISFDVSDSRMQRLYDLYGNADPAEIPRYSEQHQDFLRKFAGDIGLSIGDETFSERLMLSSQRVRDFLEKL